MTDRRSGHGRPGRAPSGNGVASLVGGGPSLVSPVGAMRARDACRPREADLAMAEKTVVVRRQSLEPHARPTRVAAADQSPAGASEPADS